MRNLLLTCAIVALVSANTSAMGSRNNAPETESAANDGTYGTTGTGTTGTGTMNNTGTMGTGTGSGTTGTTGNTGTTDMYGDPATGMTGTGTMTGDQTFSLSAADTANSRKVFTDNRSQIERAAKDAGASKASLNPTTGELKISVSPNKTFNETAFRNSLQTRVPSVSLNTSPSMTR